MVVMEGVLAVLLVAAEDQRLVHAEVVVVGETDAASHKGGGGALVLEVAGDRRRAQEQRAVLGRRDRPTETEVAGCRGAPIRMEAAAESHNQDVVVETAPMSHHQRHYMAAADQHRVAAVPG